MVPHVRCLKTSAVMRCRSQPSVSCKSLSLPFVLFLSYLFFFSQHRLRAHSLTQFLLVLFNLPLFIKFLFLVTPPSRLRGRQFNLRDSISAAILMVMTARFALSFVRVAPVSQAGPVLSIAWLHCFRLDPPLSTANGEAEEVGPL